MSNLLKKEKGFTLIEIVLVLAIAGLLLVIVFLAVSGAQKSRRDSQRKSDLGRIVSQIESSASNSNGLYPQMAAPAPTWAQFWGSNYISGSNLNDPTTSAPYVNGGVIGTAPTTLGAGTVAYRPAAACDGTPIGRGYSVYMGLEQGISCRDNK